MSSGQKSYASSSTVVAGDQAVQRHSELSGNQTFSRELRDELDLARWGKKQQLRRSFRLLSTVSFTVTLIITWASVLAVFASALINGGTAGIVYGYVFVWVGNTLQVLVMAQLGSMMPLSGGEYNWVAILAPASSAKILSYMAGWLTVIAWQAGLAGIHYICATMIQGMIVLNNPEYSFERWHGVMLFYAVLAFCVFINTALIRLLPYIEIGVFAVYLVGFFALLIPMVYFAPHGSAKEIFTLFSNQGGWPSNGLAFFVGLTPYMFGFYGIDAASHMAEEIQSASKIIPISMISSVVVNGVTGFAMTIAVLFSLGDDMESLYTTATGYPYIQLLFNATRSTGGTTAMAAIVLVTLISSAVGAVAASSRMMWAFARERGLPISGLLMKIDPRTTLPLYSIVLSASISCLLVLINLGSTAAFNAFTSVTIAASYSSYTMAAILFLMKKFKDPQSIKYGPFRLGRWEVPVIIASLVYSTIGIFFSFWPTTASPTPESMNWSIVLFGATFTFSICYYFIHGRKYYRGPIVETNVDDVLRSTT